MKFYYIYNTIIGDIAVLYEQDLLLGLFFGDENKFIDGVEKKESEFSRLVNKELSEYLKGERKEFSFKILPSGTPFQLKVYEEMIKIPYGATISYKNLAEKIGNSKSSRAVGGACNKNKIAIILPCHRVVGSTGKLTGYAGGLKLKEFLLKLEQEN